MLDTHGAGLSSVRFICGTQDIHKELERKISQFHGTEDTILYISCFDANAGKIIIFDFFFIQKKKIQKFKNSKNGKKKKGIFEAVLGEQDAIISDTLNHASIIDGIRLSKAKRYRYKHLDLHDLEEKLKEADAAGARQKMIVTDGAFSMDGEIAPLDKICNLAEKYNGFFFFYFFFF